jgi:hypothetical protein
MDGCVQDLWPDGLRVTENGNVKYFHSRSRLSSQKLFTRGQNVSFFWRASLKLQNNQYL